MEKDKHSLFVIKDKLRTIVEVHNDLSVLAEFCEVMLTSKKDKEEIVSELEVFLNDSAGPFADWLVSNAEAEINARRHAEDSSDAPKLEEPAEPAKTTLKRSPKKVAPKDNAHDAAKQSAKEVTAKARKESGTREPSAPVAPPKDAEPANAADSEVVVTDDGEGSVVVVDDEDTSPKRKAAKRSRSPISTDGERDASESERPTRAKRLLLRARRDRDRSSPRRARLKLVEKKKEGRLARKGDRVSPLGNALLMARAVKDATGTETQPTRVAPSRIVRRASLRKRSAVRHARSRSRSVRKQKLRKKRSRSRSKRSPSVESFSVQSSEPSGKRRVNSAALRERKHSDRRSDTRRLAVSKKKLATVAYVEPKKLRMKAREPKMVLVDSPKRAAREPHRDKPEKIEAAVVSKSSKRYSRQENAKTNDTHVKAYSNANTELDDKELDNRIARLERLEKLQEQTRKNREELADMDIPLRLQPATSYSSRPPVRLKARAPTVANPTVAPRMSTSPSGLRRTEPFEVVKWRVIVDKLEVNAGLVKAAGDPVKILMKGEIVEQTDHQIMDNGIPLIPIAHPSSSKYPAPIGWVSLDTTSQGGQKCLEPGPAFIKGKHTKGKGKGKAVQKGWKGYDGKGYSSWSHPAY